MPTPLTFGGFDLNRYAYVQLERQPGPSLRSYTQEVSGRSGEAFLGATLEPLVVIAHCTLRRSYVRDWDAVRSALEAAFCVTERKQLTLPDEGGLTRMASATFSSTASEPVDPPVEFDITFTDHDACAYGATRTATVPSGGSVSVTVDGTLPTYPVLSCASAVRSTSTNLWGVRLDNGDVLRVDTGSDSARRVDIDCCNRTCKVAWATSMITLDSNWFVLTPGTHTLRMDQGSGSCSITWRERWL